MTNNMEGKFYVVVDLLEFGDEHPMTLIHTVGTKEEAQEMIDTALDRLTKECPQYADSIEDVKADSDFEETRLAGVEHTYYSMELEFYLESCMYEHNLSEIMS